MEKKQILLTGVFSGMGLILVPKIFLDSSILIPILKYLGYIAMAGGVIFFIAGDAIMQRKNNIKGITPQQKHDLEMAKLNLELAKTKKQREIEIEKAKIVKIKQSNNVKGKKSKLPDVLSNLGGITGSNKKDKSKGSDLRDLF